MYSLKKDKSIIIKGADKGAAVIVWNHEDYLKEANKKLEDKEVYLEVQNDSSALVSTIFKSLEKIRKRWDLSQDIFNFFLFKDPNLQGFTYYLKFINSYMMYVGEQSFLTVIFRPKIFLLF